ncbi:hypothetical protein QJ856_gp0424 [Tupanvirus deep ocean]|uniref:Uncharacterized protein n=2 Tax=Tupanvirus TaxID=2094720 RepID=A0AC62A9J3_9VIRU|nr:hypothetical protein QJ856_gp0424 [Tupanvirus deep ocean]QKU34320.1 hypothetical protein [Tupanvirus deep ocean]
MFDLHIYIDGIDGTGKTTLVKMLRDAGYKNVHDRSILTQMSLVPIKDLPSEILDNNIIIKQIQKVKEIYPAEELKTNRDVMTKLNLDGYDDLQNDNTGNSNAVYFILDAEVQTCLNRLSQRVKETGIELNAWDSEESICYFKSKYIYLGYKYRIPIIDTNNKTLDEVYNNLLDLIEGRTFYDPHFDYVQIMAGDDFNPDALELEWLHLGISRILYSDGNLVVHLGTKLFSVRKYQKKVLSTIAKNSLDKFTNDIRIKDKNINK